MACVVSLMEGGQQHPRTASQPKAGQIISDRVRQIKISNDFSAMREIKQLNRSCHGRRDAPAPNDICMPFKVSCDVSDCTFENVACESSLNSGKAENWDSSKTVQYCPRLTGHEKQAQVVSSSLSSTTVTTTTGAMKTPRIASANRTGFEHRLCALFTLYQMLAILCLQAGPSTGSPNTSSAPCQSLMSKSVAVYERHPSNCSVFYICHGGKHWQLSCTSDNTVFSVRHKVCVWRQSTYDDCEDKRSNNQSLVEHLTNTNRTENYRDTTDQRTLEKSEENGKESVRNMPLPPLREGYDTPSQISHQTKSKPNRNFQQLWLSRPLFGVDRHVGNHFPSGQQTEMGTPSQHDPSLTTKTALQGQKLPSPLDKKSTLKNVGLIPGQHVTVKDSNMVPKDQQSFEMRTQNGREQNLADVPEGTMLEPTPYRPTFYHPLPLRKSWVNGLSRDLGSEQDRRRQNGHVQLKTEGLFSRLRNDRVLKGNGQYTWYENKLDKKNQYSKWYASNIGNTSYVQRGSPVADHTQSSQSISSNSVLVTPWAQLRARQLTTKATPKLNPRDPQYKASDNLRLMQNFIRFLNRTVHKYDGVLTTRRYKSTTPTSYRDVYLKSKQLNPQPVPLPPVKTQLEKVQKQTTKKIFPQLKDGIKVQRNGHIQLQKPDQKFWQHRGLFYRQWYLQEQNKKVKLTTSIPPQRFPHQDIRRMWQKGPSRMHEKTGPPNLQKIQEIPTPYPHRLTSPFSYLRFRDRKGQPEYSYTGVLQQTSTPHIHKLFQTTTPIRQTSTPTPSFSMTTADHTVTDQFPLTRDRTTRPPFHTLNSQIEEEEWTREPDISFEAQPIPEVTLPQPLTSSTTPSGLTTVPTATTTTVEVTTTEIPLEERGKSPSSTDGNFLPAYRQELNERCGVLATPLIIGGRRARPGQWPWQASLQIVTSTTPWHRCGGVLVHSRWVLTAAHCVEGPFYGDVSNWRVVMSDYDLDSVSGNEIYREVTRVISHPGYIRSSNFPNDVALLELNMPVDLTSGDVQTACLPDPSFALTPGTQCWISGWGETRGSGGQDNAMNEVPVEVLSSDVCKGMWGRVNIDVLDSQVCVGYGETGACYGDSGGPLMCESNGRYYVAGVMSWLINNCSAQNFPNVFTRLPNYMDWMFQELDYFEWLRFL